jgi:hypothetical protein
MRISLVAIASIVFCFAAPLHAEPSSSEHLLLKRVPFVDHHGFGRAMEAASILLPKDWQADAAVRWTGDVGCPQNAVHLTLQAQSPDRRLGFEVFPAYVWQWSDDPATMQAAQQAMAPFGIRGCDVLPPYDAAEYLQQVFLPRWRPGATLVEVGHVPELAQALQLEQQAAAAGAPPWIRTEFDVALALVETAGEAGPVEEWVLATVMRTITRPPPMYGLPQLPGSYSMAAFSQFAARAPKGELERNAKLFELIYRSFRTNPVWDAGVMQFHLNVAAIQQKGAADRARIIAESNREIGAIIDQVYRSREASRDRSFERQIQALRGQETWIDPGTGTGVQLSTGYQGAWSNGLGDYVLSDVPGFDPGRVLGGSWTALERPAP